jgi:hypothetical protein
VLDNILELIPDKAEKKATEKLGKIPKIDCEKRAGRD